MRNIGALYVHEVDAVPVPNDARLSPFHDVYVRVEDGVIREYGSESELEPEQEPRSEPTLDAKGGSVIPGLIDAHTHLVFAGSREDELVQRSLGKSYLDIAKAGGGIRSTVRAVRGASKEELVELALPRLARMLANGVTTLEIKSGYGLNVPDEIKMLEAVKELENRQPIELVPTLLAAHTVPDEYLDRRSAYVDLVTSDELLGRVADQGLAEFVDVFCEESAFTVAESRRILEAAKAKGLAPKIHADQITNMGASLLAAELGAVTAEHLECVDEEGIRALAKAGVIGGFLPGCSLFLGGAPAPARRLIEGGVPLLVATDYNPGSSMIESLPLVLSTACTLGKLTPQEALVGATANAAAGLGRGDRLGRITVGLQADLVVLDAPSVDSWLYEVGRNSVRTVIQAGRVIFERPDTAN